MTLASSAGRLRGNFIGIFIMSSSLLWHFVDYIIHSIAEIV